MTRPFLGSPEVKLALATQSDCDWFERLYERSFDSVYRFALVLMRDPSEAEDVAAEVFIKAWRARHHCHSREAALAWLLTITRNCAVDRRRASSPQVDLEHAAGVEDERLDPSIGLLSGEQVQLIRRSLSSLTDEQQLVVILRFFEGLSHDEVATKLGKTAAAVRVTQFRALQKMRTTLAEALRQR